MYPAYAAAVHLFKVTITAALTIAHPPAHYTVHAGDSLSAIAASQCHAPADWTGIYAVNRRAIGRNPDLIRVGTELRISCSGPPAITRLAAGYRPGGSRYAAADRDGDGDYDGDRGAYRAYRAYRSHGYRYHGYRYHVYHRYHRYGGYYGGTSSYERCVIARESGGRSQVMNSTGHYGLYQFSYSTWVAYGGRGADFGHASAAEQRRVFRNAMATPGGRANWSPYDGC